jgi:hypothetical protein
MFLGHKHMFLGFWLRNICLFLVVAVARKPPLMGANSTLVRSKKEWRPRISVFERLGYRDG